MHGRLSSTYNMIWGTMPITSLPMSMAADVIGAPLTLAATGARMPVVAIGPQTAAEAQAAGLAVAAVAATHDLDGLVEALRSSAWSSRS